jgi:hypothetical protein
MNSHLQGLVKQLEGKIPKKSSLIKKLMALLNISQDSVYRRLRGESEFTFSEIALIAKRYNLSIDSMLFKSTAATSFRFNTLFDESDSLFNYMDQLTRQMELLRNTKGHLTFVASELPISQSFQNQTLREFKIFYWQKVVLNQDRLRGTKFTDDFGIGMNTNQFVDSLMNSYANIQKTEIWTEETLDDTLRQLTYCADSGLMDETMLKKVCQSIVDMLNRLEGELEMPSEVVGGSMLRFFVSSVELGNNVILMNFGDLRTAYIKFNTFNTVSTESPIFCTEIEKMVKSTLTKCVEISGKSDIHRHKYFNLLRRKVKTMCDQYTR